jgi:hypothetical protein
MINPFSWLQRQVLFTPERSLRGTPEHVGLEYEDLLPVTADGVKLHGWHMPGESPDVIWLIFHGNGGNISVRLDQYQEIHRRYDASIIAIDYRGSGRSEGAPSEDGFYADAFTAFEVAAELHPGKKVVVFGRSMGGPVAAQLATRTSPAVLILEAAISSMPEIIRERAPWIRFTPLPIMFRTKLDTKSFVASSSVPTLILHGDSDQTVSYANAERIFESAAEPKQLEIIPGGDHDELDLVNPERYHAALGDFLAKYDAL